MNPTKPSSRIPDMFISTLIYRPETRCNPRYSIIWSTERGRDTQRCGLYKAGFWVHCSLAIRGGVRRNSTHCGGKLRKIFSYRHISYTLFGYEFSNIVENSILKKHLSFAKNSKVICLISANISFQKNTIDKYYNQT